MTEANVALMKGLNQDINILGAIVECSEFTLFTITLEKGSGIEVSRVNSNFACVTKEAFTDKSIFQMKNKAINRYGQHFQILPTLFRMQGVKHCNLL
jgi:hypothetical protein